MWNQSDLSAGQAEEATSSAEEASTENAVELVGVWIDPELEERAEVACCLLYFFVQCLLSNDAITSLEQGAALPWGRGGGGVMLGSLYP